MNIFDSFDFNFIMEKVKKGTHSYVRGQRDIDIDIDDIGHYRYRHRYWVTDDIDIDIFIDKHFFLIFCENHISLVCCDTKLHVKHQLSSSLPLLGCSTCISCIITSVDFRLGAVANMPPKSIVWTVFTKYYSNIDLDLDIDDDPWGAVL